MRIDSIHKAPFMSREIKRINGGHQIDKRIKLNRSIENVNYKVDNYSLISYKRYEMEKGLNTSRSVKSKSNKEKYKNNY